MKPKKPYSGKYPVLFYQPEWNRLRIFYPDGRSEWSYPGFGWDSCYCCFGRDAKSIDDLVKAANGYDVFCGLPPMEFIGEIK